MAADAEVAAEAMPALPPLEESHIALERESSRPPSAQPLRPIVFNASVTTPPLGADEGCMPAHLGEFEAKDNQRGIGHDLWANNPPLPNGTSRVFVPRLGTTTCVVRGNPLEKKQPTSVDRATALLHSHSLTHHDFPTMQKFLSHTYELVYPNSYAINSWPTRSDPGKLQELDPNRHLRVYKMIDAKVFQRAIRRQAYDRGVKVEKDYTKVGHVTEEVRVVPFLSRWTWIVILKLGDPLLTEPHCTVYTFLDDKRNVCLATDAYELPTHDPHDSYFLQWLQTYDMVSHLETYVAPTEPVTIPELAWTLHKPTVYVVRVLPAGNTAHTTARYKERTTRDCVAASS